MRRADDQPVASPPQDTGKGERTSLRITAAACQLFIEQGYHATSMREIAKAADIALGGIYNHFPNKEAIFSAVLEEYHPWREIPPAVEAAQGETVEELVRDAGERILQAWNANADLTRLHLIELVEFQAQHLPALFETFFVRMTDAARKGSASRAIPVAVLARAFLGLFFAYLASGQFTDAALPIDLGPSAFDYFADVYLQGLLAQTRAENDKPKTS